ncbi:MAG: hypothetical protein WAV51_02940 [Microgenomates group bacterium]
MKQFWQKNKFVLLAFAVWGVTLQLIEKVSYLIPIRTGYFGVSPWGNFDGVHYVKIAESGYYQYAYAFFPVYPLLMRAFHQILPLPYEYIGVGISLISFLIGLMILYALLAKKSQRLAKFTTVFLLAFPTSFFFRAVYTEGLFFLCVVLVMHFVSKKQLLWAGVVIAVASAIRIIGICLALYALIEYIGSKPKNIRIVDILGFLIMPIGLFWYMYFLNATQNDPFLFMHVQSAFGANRSGSALISPPQVVWRYLKMLVTAYMQPTVMSYLVTVLEFVMTGISYVALWLGRKRISLAALLYCLVVLTIPTLTGTFSSMPRYILAAVPLFIILGSIPSKKIKISLLLGSTILEIMATALFLRGWFIA